MASPRVAQRLATEEAEDLGGAAHLGHRFGQDLALFPRQHPPDHISLGLDAAGDAVQQLGPRQRTLGLPCGQGRRGRLRRAVDVIGGSGGVMADQIRQVGRVAVFGQVVARHPRAVDQVQMRIGHGGHPLGNTGAFPARRGRDGFRPRAGRSVAGQAAFFITAASIEASRISSASCSWSVGMVSGGSRRMTL